MFITTKSVYRDTGNFFCNQFFIILIITLLCALTKIILCFMLAPSETQMAILSAEYNLTSNTILFEIIHNMTLEQQQILLRASAASSFADLIGNTILISSTSLMIRLISSDQHINMSQEIKTSILLLPKLLILIFLIMLLVQAGIILIIFPGIVLAIMLSFAPVILVKDRTSISTSMCTSIKLAWCNIHLIAPAIIIWFSLKAIILLFISCSVVLTTNISMLIINVVNNLVSVMLLIYIFRLYMLLHQEEFRY